MNQKCHWIVPNSDAGVNYYLKEFFVDFEREDIDRLIFALDAEGGRIFGGTLFRDDGVPFLDEETRRDAVDGDAHGADKRLVLLLLPIRLPVQIDVDVVHDGQVVELKVLAPEAQVILLLSGRPSVQRLVKAEFAKIPTPKRESHVMSSKDFLLTGCSFYFYHFLLATPLASRIQILRELSVRRTCS